MKTKVTRRTIVGYAVNTSPTQDAQGYHFDLPERPYWTGTLKTVGEQLSEDRYLNSLKSGGTYYSSAWFVKVNGTWMRATDWRQFSDETDYLYYKREEGCGCDLGYIVDEVEVDVDYPTETARAAAALGSIKSEKRAAASRENGKMGGRGHKRQVA